MVIQILRFVGKAIAVLAGAYAGLVAGLYACSFLPAPPWFILTAAIWGLVGGGAVVAYVLTPKHRRKKVWG